MMMNNCFAYSTNKQHCKAIERKMNDCNGGCSFYKERESFKRQVKDCQKRCKSLGIPFGAEYSRWKELQEKADENKRQTIIATD